MVAALAPGDGGRQQRLELLPVERAYLVHADDVAIAGQDRQAVRQGLDCHIVPPGVIFPHEVIVRVYASVVGCDNELVRGGWTRRRRRDGPGEIKCAKRVLSRSCRRRGSTSAGASRFRTGTATCVEMTMTGGLSRSCRRTRRRRTGILHHLVQRHALFILWPFCFGVLEVARGQHREVGSAGGAGPS